MTLNELYDELERILTDVQEYSEDTDGGNLSSDLRRGVENPLENMLVALDTIIDDQDAGLYEEDTNDEFLGEEEEF